MFTNQELIKRINNLEVGMGWGSYPSTYGYFTYILKLILEADEADRESVAQHHLDDALKSERSRGEAPTTSIAIDELRKLLGIEVVKVDKGWSREAVARQAKCYIGPKTREMLQACLASDDMKATARSYQKEVKLEELHSKDRHVQYYAFELRDNIYKVLGI